MHTNHRTLFTNAQSLSVFDPNSVDLVVTSPPYPMIAMWDELFIAQNPQIKDALEKKDGFLAFELMHQELDKVWREITRLVKPGGIVCINIGEATRSMDSNFNLYPSKSRIINSLVKLDYNMLPSIIWRKQTNSPTKFMGSGMLPPGAYVTLEHEHILIFRKGSRRLFKSEDEKEKRRKSAYFWEERNKWFSDFWDFKGKTQKMTHERVRERSAAFPLILALRLILMFSIYGDTVFDPFLGTGTTQIAAMITARNSLGVEIDPNFENIIENKMKKMKKYSENYINQRIKDHLDFIEERKSERTIKYINKHYNFPVVTKQERNIYFYKLNKIQKLTKNNYECNYE